MSEEIVLYSELPALPTEVCFHNLVLRPIRVLGSYEILSNDDEELLFKMPVLEECAKDSAVMYYDGYEHGLLVTSAEVVVCDCIHPDVRRMLRACEEVLVAEIEGDTICQEYNVPVKMCGGVKPLAARLIRRDRRRKKEQQEEPKQKAHQFTRPPRAAQPDLDAMLAVPGEKTKITRNAYPTTMAPTRMQGLGAFIKDGVYITPQERAFWRSRKSPPPQEEEQAAAE